MNVQVINWRTDEVVETIHGVTSIMQNLDGYLVNTPLGPMQYSSSEYSLKVF